MRTRHRRRYHTWRIIQKRQARHRRMDQEWFWPEGPLPDGWLDNEDWYHGCHRARCGLCRYEKLEGGRRTRENREWRRDWGL